MDHYTSRLRQHYEDYYQVKGNPRYWNEGPKNSIDKVHPDFFVLELKPNDRHEMWTYATVGMSVEREDENLIELIVYSSIKDDAIVELLTVNASFHRTENRLIFTTR